MLSALALILLAPLWLPLAAAVVAALLSVVAVLLVSISLIPLAVLAALAGD